MLVNPRGLTSTEFPSPVSSIFSRVSRATGFCRVAHVFLVVFLLSLVWGQPVLAQTSETQEIHLSQGWNLVGLHVQPEDPSFEALLGEHLSQISIAKDEKGNVYVPSENITNLTTWESDEGYLIYAEEALNIHVAGAPLSPALTPIPLREGGNLIPYLPTNAQPPHEAFSSVEETLVQAEDREGNVYNPEQSVTELDSLRPGHGYKLYVSQPDTLTYPDEGGQSDTITVNTLADARRLTGMDAGQYVRVQGYHQPGDGGGGLFQVNESDCTTDGGTCFVFHEDVSSIQSVTTPPNGDGLTSPHSLPDSNLVWETVEVQYGESENESIGTRHLHGHSAASKQYDWIDYEAGTVGSSGARFKHLREWKTNDGDGPFTIRYKHATSDRRLQRVNVGNAVNVDWWGAVEANPATPVNNWWRIACAINKAAEIYRKNDVEWTYVDIPGEYYYRYTIRIRNGVKLRGTSEQTFDPAANGQPTHGKLTIAPGMALNYLTEGGAPKALHHLGYRHIDLTHAHMVEKVGLERLEIDGNVSNNLAPIEDPNDEYGDVQSRLQNANAWNGFASKNANSWETSPEAVADFDAVYIHDFPGNGIGVNSALDFSRSSDVRVGDAARNHQLYRTRGLHNGWTIEGSGWASLLKVTSGTFQNLTIHPSPNALNEYWGTTWFKVFDHHGKGFGADWFADEDFISDLNIEVDGFSVDLTNEPRSHPAVFADRGYGGTYTNGTIESTPNRGTTIIRPVDTGGNGPIRDYRYENITVTDQGGGVSLVNGDVQTHNIVKDVTIKPASGVGPNGRGLIGPMMGAPTEFAEKNEGNDIPLEMAARLDITGLDAQVPQNNWIVQPRGEGSMPFDLFLSNSAIANTAQSDKSTGILRSPPSYFRLYLDNTTINVYWPLPPYRASGFHKYVLEENPRLRLRNAQDRQGRVSDTSGTYTSDASDEGTEYVLIPTNLMSRAQARSATLTSSPSGISSVTSVEVANADGTLRPWDPDDPTDQRDPYLKVNLDGTIGSGETVTIEWSARVTPLADYRTTGLFVARPVDDQTYTASTNVPTIDLRGVAASQASREPIEYTASSEDAGIATASVGADGYTLTVTPQGTGTTTITVTGEITGVGTTTDTFDVTIE